MIERLQPLFTEIAIVTKNTEKFKNLSANIVEDTFKEHSSMIGLYSGLAAVNNSIAFIIPCDAPLAPISLIENMSDHVGSADVTLLASGNDNIPIPLPGFYNKTVLPIIKDRIAKKNYKILDFLMDIEVLRIPESTWRTWDPDGHAQININTRQDYKTAYTISQDQ